MTTRTLTDLLGIDRPIVLGPFGGLSSVALTAAVSSAGGLGSYGLYGYDGARIRETIGRISESSAMISAEAQAGSPSAMSP